MADQIPKLPSGNETGPQPRGVQFYLFALLALLSGAFAVSQFLRNSTGVLAPELAAEAGLAPEGLGFLAGAFFLTFALAQIPMGVLLDRYGPSKCMGIGMLFIAAGCLVFAAGASLGELAFGRALMGLGCAPMLVGSLTIVGRWFEMRMFSTLISVLMITGNIGALLSTAPLAYTAELIGWRTVFSGFAVLALVLGALIIRMLLDAPPGHAYHRRGRQSWGDSLSGVIVAMRLPDVSGVLLMQAAVYPVFAAIVGIWGPSYLSDVHGFTLAERGNAMLLVVLGLVIGSLLVGPLDRIFNCRKPIVMAGGAGLIILLALLAIYPTMPAELAMAALIAIGLASSVNVTLIAHGRALFPESLVARGLTLMNFGVMVGVFVLQWGAGLLIELVTGEGAVAGALSASAYAVCFAGLAIAMTIALAAYSVSRDRVPGPPGQ